jgi:hypothetical protein
MLAFATPIKQVVSLVHAGWLLFGLEVNLNMIQKPIVNMSKIEINKKLSPSHFTKSANGFGIHPIIEPTM